jgi:hypothetical protein
MLRLFSILVLLMLSFSFSRCMKNYPEVGPQTETYAGTFYYRSPLGSDSGKTTMKLSGNSYTSTGNPNRIPAGGSGNYQVSDKQILFKDINVWTADFDYKLVLNGLYNYQTKSDSLIFSKTDSVNKITYQYRLKRIN